MDSKITPVNNVLSVRLSQVDIKMLSSTSSGAKESCSLLYYDEVINTADSTTPSILMVDEVFPARNKGTLKPAPTAPNFQEVCNFKQIFPATAW